MTYADPFRCPDCRGPITPGSAACPACRLTLTGATAQRLFTTLSAADRLLAELRAATPAATVATAAAATVPAPRSQDAPRRSGGLRASSVPRILLGLGAVCLLVAALVFLAVTWSVLGVGGRTATLVALTAVAGGLSAWFQRRGLRAAAESLALVGYGLLVLDVLGADQAGWWGNPSPAALLVLVGTTLLVTGAGAAIAVRRSLGSTLRSGQVVAAVGSALIAVAWGTATWLPVAPSLVVATVMSAGLALAARRAGLDLAFVNMTAVTAAAWACLTALGLDRTLGASTWAALLDHAHGWPLVAAAALVGAVALVRRLPVAARVAAAGLAQLLVVVALLAPARHLDPTPATLVALAVLALAGVLTLALDAVAPSAWRLCSLGTQALAGVAALVASSAISLESADRLLQALADPWSGAAGDFLPGTNAAGLPAPWLLPVCLVGLLGTAWVLAGRRVSAADGRTAGEAFGALVVAGAGIALAGYPVPIWLLLAVLLLVSAVLVTAWVVVRSEVTLGAGALFAAAAVGVGLHATVLTEVALVVVLTICVLVQPLADRRPVAAVASGVAVASLAALAWTTGALAHVAGRETGLMAIALLGALVLLTPYLPAGWWSTDVRPVRTAGELSAAVAALPVTLAGLEDVPAGELATWLAVYLTLAGVVVTAVSLLRTDRRQVAWAGGLLLALASWVRLWDLGVHAPEAYTLPSALVLLLVGLAHLRRRPEATTMTALAPGLALALVPSLLWALVEDPGARALLLGLACLALVLVGLRLGWTAPLLAGAAVGLLLVLRLGAPYVGTAVPRWMLIGLAGALLVAMGATWERRLREARQLAGYVRGLR